MSATTAGPPDRGTFDDAVARALAAAGLFGLALIHLLDAHDTFVETPYKGWLFVGLIASSLALGATLVRRSDARTWAAVATLSLSAAGGFVYSRTVGLPAAPGDIGNWWEPLGLASLFLSGSLGAFAGVVAAVKLRAAAPAAARSPRVRTSLRPTAPLPSRRWQGRPAPRRRRASTHLSGATTSASPA